MLSLSSYSKSFLQEGHTFLLYLNEHFKAGQKKQGLPEVKNCGNKYPA